MQLQTATNNFSTEQLYEKLAVNDCKIIFSKSWDTLGMARLVVYVRGDLKSIQMLPQDACNDDIQNITLERHAFSKI